jgi:hypothetical protein
LQIRGPAVSPVPFSLYIIHKHGDRSNQKPTTGAGWIKDGARQHDRVRSFGFGEHTIGLKKKSALSKEKKKNGLQKYR